LKQLGYEGGICADARDEAAESLAAELGWRSGAREEAAACDVVVTVTPADAPVVRASDLRAGPHFAVIGADVVGKAEVEPEALGRCRLYCDEWEQASRGGELAGGVAAGAVSRAEVSEIGEVLLGNEGGRASAEEITLFDSTGLAIQDLGIALGVLEAWRAGRIDAPTAAL